MCDALEQVILVWMKGAMTEDAQGLSIWLRQMAAGAHHKLEIWSDIAHVEVEPNFYAKSGTFYTTPNRSMSWNQSPHHSGLDIRTKHVV